MHRDTLPFPPERTSNIPLSPSRTSPLDGVFLIFLQKKAGLLSPAPFLFSEKCLFKNQQQITLINLIPFTKDQFLDHAILLGLDVGLHLHRIGD